MDPTVSGKRIWIFDPCLTIVASHNYSEACALVREAQTLKRPLRIFCHARASAAVRQLPAEPLFRQSGYSHILAAKPSADFLAAAFCNQATLQDLQPFTSQVAADDFVLFPTVTGNIVLAICQWLAEFAPDRMPGVGLCLMFSPDCNTVGAPSAVMPDYYRRAFALLTPAMRCRMTFTCETPVLTEIYEPLVGKRPLTLPLPTWSGTAPAADRPRRLTISFLGDARSEKGFALLPDIAALVLQSRPDVRFVVQAVGNDPQLVNEVAARLATHGDAVQVRLGALSGEELFAAIQASNLLLLPYDGSKYRDRGSSFFTEAKALGVPLVLPSGTCIGDEAQRKGLGELFDEFTAASAAAATVRAIDALEPLTAAARREASVMQANHRSYLAVLLRSLGWLH